jgi:hypothetical protein
VLRRWGVAMSEYEGGNKEILSSARPSWGGSAAFPWWLRTIVVIGALLMVTGALIALMHPALLVSPHDEINGAVHIYAGYLASRNLALAILLLAAMRFRARGTLNTLMLLTAFIQVLDVGIDCVEGRWAIVPGVVVFGLLFFVGSARLSGYPFWRKGAWRQDELPAHVE